MLQTILKLELFTLKALFVLMTSRKNLRQHFQLGVLSTFLNASKILLIYIVLDSVIYFFLAI